MKKFLVFLIFIFFSSFLTSSVFAHHRGMVLGETTDPAQLDLPIITQGTGFLLPDSPLYFLDDVYQNIRLKLTFDPQERAKLGTQIAGERLAELKIMLSKNNPRGIDVALSRLKTAENLTNKNLNEANAKGLNIGNLSQEINDAFLSHQKALEKLENQANGSLRLKFKAAREGVKETKLEVEDQLPKDVLEQEIQNGLEREIKETEKNLELEKKKQERLLKTREEMTEKKKNLQKLPNSEK